MACKAPETTIEEAKEVTMNRKATWAVLVIGLALVIAPFAFGLPGKAAAGALLVLGLAFGIAPFGFGLRGKAAAGQRMMSGFEPIIQPDQVATTARYYNQVFVPLGTVTPMMSAEILAKFQ